MLKEHAECPACKYKMKNGNSGNGKSREDRIVYAGSSPATPETQLLQMQ